MKPRRHEKLPASETVMKWLASGPSMKITLE